MKKLLLIMVIAFLGITTTKAAEVYYINDNNITFTEEEYDFVSKILWDGYQKDMTLEEYNSILGNGISNDIEIVKYPLIMPLNTSYTTSSKSLVISKASFTDYTLISLTLTWKANPLNRSYDLIGAYLDGLSLYGTVSTRLTGSSSNYSSNYIKSSSNGFGVSVLLPVYDSNIIVSQTFKVKGNGEIFASYQHATSTVSLADSQKYTISNLESGKVFLFDRTIYNKYDQMSGVNISI